LLEVWKLEGAGDVVLVYYRPVRPFRYLFVDIGKLLALERGDSATARNAGFASQGHRLL
jgi:hypothetical protein